MSYGTGYSLRASREWESWKVDGKTTAKKNFLCYGIAAMRTPRGLTIIEKTFS